VTASQLIEKYCNGKVASKIEDIFPAAYKGRIIEIKINKFEKIIGVKIEAEKIISILKNLGFTVNTAGTVRDLSLKVTVPSHRKYDVFIEEDLIEEVARIYGYNNIPSILQPIVYVDQPKDMENIFTFQNKIKLLLKHLGLNEVINYSMISKEQLLEFNYDPEKHLRLSNSLSKDIEYLRSNLTISLYKNIIDNQGRKDILRMFEIAKVYLPRKTGLPEEIYKVGIATNTDYLDLKGIIEAIYAELNINAGTIPELSEPEIIEKNNVFLAEIDFIKLVSNSRLFKIYQPVNPYAVIKLDKTFEIQPPLTFSVIKEKAFKSGLLKKIEVVSVYQNKLSLRFFYSSKVKNITEEEAKKELEKL
jgi:phenylalanyl-tRNA synthetase beta chain